VAGRRRRGGEEEGMRRQEGGELGLEEGRSRLYREVGGLDGLAFQMGHELGIDEPTGEWNGGLASPRASC
jgi:hypothetical protein